MFNYPRVWIIFKNGSVLKVFSSQEKANKYFEIITRQDVDDAISGNYPLGRFWISEQPVFD